MGKPLVSRPWAARSAAGLIALLTATALAAFGASPASAFLVRLKNGKVLSYEAFSGSKAPPMARRFDAVFSNLDYSGGPVMPSNTNYTIVWNPSNYAGTPFQSGYTTGVNTFLSDVAHDSGTTTNSYSVGTQYNDANGHVAAYNSTFGGTFTDADPLPTNGCTSGAICLTDAQLQSELDSFLRSQDAPRDLQHEYFLLTPPDVVTCFDSAGTACSGNATTNPAFCAYHSASATATSFLYANIPYMTGVFGCDPFVTSCPNFACNYDNGPADGVLSAVSHETIESNTDPEPNNAWTDWQQCGQGSPMTCGGEIGDKCNGDAFADPTIQLQDDGFGTDTPFNYVINGTHYLIQREWSNQTDQCAHSFTPNGTTVTASYAASQGSTDTLNFDASASTATGGVDEYVWQFNDDPQFGQTTTQETTSPTFTHTFPAPGLYTVALTAMANDGTSSGTAQTLIVGPLLNPTASFTANPASALEGTSISFDASSSSDLNAGGAITNYSWDFGDGATAGPSPTPSHAFTVPGVYTVTLTVTDNFGKASSTQRTVTITDEAPSAVFSPPSGVAGTPVAFSGSGSDPDGFITAFAWSFGDGGSGAGASASHTYAAGGTYNVVLTVTDSSGDTASVSHLVSIASAPPTPPPPTPPPISPPPLPPPSTTCTVPNVVGKSLGAARNAITAAKCALGKVSGPGKKPRRSPGKHKKWSAVVGREQPAAGSTRSQGTKVTLTLVWKAVVAPRYG